MKKGLVIIAFGLAFCLLTGFSAFHAAAQSIEPPVWLPASAADKNQVPEIEASLIDSSTVRMTIRFPGVWAQAYRNEHGFFTGLSLQSYGNSNEPGLPDLPLYLTELEIPAGARPELTVIDQSFVMVSLEKFNLPQNILPAQIPAPKSGPQPPWSPPDGEVYGQSEPFPRQQAALRPTYELREHILQPLQVWPVRYLPASGEIHLLQEITLEIRWQPVEMQPAQNRLRYENPDFSALLQNKLNFSMDAYGGTDSEMDVQPGYMIIAPDDFSTALAPLIDLKTQAGFYVELIPLSAAGSPPSPESIKAVIQHAYDNWTRPPVYLLLVGDTNLIPAWPGDEIDHSLFTDLFYATMDGKLDYTPDIFYGRLPVRSTQQLVDVLNKLIAYEQSNGSESWVKKASFIATCDEGYYNVAEATHNDVIENHTLPALYQGIFPANPQPGGDRLFCKTHGAELDDIQNAINDQRGLLVYSGHGSTDGWEMGFTGEQVTALSDNKVYPFVASFACKTNDFSMDEAFSETWLLQPDKGAVAYLGSVDYSYWNEDDLLERSLFDTLFMDPNNPPPLGRAIFTGLHAVGAKYIQDSAYYWETYNLLGDPSLRIWIGPRIPDFLVYTTPSQSSICTPEDTSIEVSIVSQNGFSDQVQLEISPLPFGVTAEFSNPTVIPTGQSQLMLSAGSQAEPGEYNLSIWGSSGILNHENPFTLWVANQSPQNPILLTPEQNSQDQPIKPHFSWLPVEQALQYYFEVALDPDFNRIVFEAEVEETSFQLPTALDTSTAYYWRVTASNACGQGQPSAVFQFHTLAGPGDCPNGFETILIYQDDLESSPTDWLTAKSVGEPDWVWESIRARSPSHAFYAEDSSSVSDLYLVSPEFSIPFLPVIPTLQFWQWLDLEPSSSGCYDGGLLEFSINTGQNWKPVQTSALLTTPYSGMVSTTFDNPIGSMSAWCGQADWQKTVIDLNRLRGKNVRFRFRLGTDAYNPASFEGWYIDDIKLQTCLAPHNTTLPLVFR